MVSTVHRHHKFTFHHCFHSFVQFLDEKKNCCNRQPTICKCCFLFVNSIAVGLFSQPKYDRVCPKRNLIFEFFRVVFGFSKYAVKFWTLQSYNHTHKCVRSRIETVHELSVTRAVYVDHSNSLFIVLFFRLVYTCSHLT